MTTLFNFHNIIKTLNKTRNKQINLSDFYLICNNNNLYIMLILNKKKRIYKLKKEKKNVCLYIKSIYIYYIIFY